MHRAVDDPDLVKDGADGEGEIVRNDVDAKDADADADAEDNSADVDGDGEDADADGSVLPTAGTPRASC